MENEVMRKLYFIDKAIYVFMMLCVGEMVQVFDSANAIEITDYAKEITVWISCQSRSGSGALVAKEGDSYWVLTANHLVKTSDNCSILTKDGETHRMKGRNTFTGIDASMISFSSNNSYCLAKIVDSKQAKELDVVYVSGFPSPGTAITKQTFQITKGEISGKGKYSDGYGLIYTNVTREGMSGGPVLDSNGNLIGIHGRAEGVRTSDGTPVNAGFNLGIPTELILTNPGASNLIVFKPGIPAPRPLAQSSSNKPELSETQREIAEIRERAAAALEALKLPNSSRNKPVNINPNSPKQARPQVSNSINCL